MLRPDPSTPLPLLVGGALVESATARTLTVVDPATGEPVSTLPVASADDVDAAVGAARAAAPGWRRTSPAERGAALKRAARALREVVDELALLQSREGGKPIGDSRGGVEAGIGAIEQYAEVAPLLGPPTLLGAPDAADYTLRVPRGVAAVITPWNDPVAICGQNLAAALATGNTVVFKPSERTPACSAALADALAAELPPGVLNVVHGDATTGKALAGHCGVDVVLFVGSTAAGDDIRHATAETGAKPVLELGGKDALVIDAGVDPTWAAAQAALGAFANAGQICTAVERIYVHEAVADEVVAALVKEAESRVLGDPRDAATTLGPMVDGRMRDAVHAHVEQAVAAGARLLTGGTLPDGPGSAYPATVLVGVTDDMAVMSDETFGPVAAVAVVPSYDEGLARAARSTYGLAATVLTADMRHAVEAIERLDVGTVKVNAVFGGAPGGSAEPRRSSGNGRGYGPGLLEELTSLKVVHWEPPGA